MVMEKTHDLIISGSGHAAGGTYETIDISGYGRVNGDIECEKFKVSGSAKISGNVKAEAFKVSGTAHHYGNVESRYLDISGSTSIDGHVAAAELTVSGSLKIGKHLSGEKLDVSGGIRVKESCAMEKFKVKGSFDIGGMLNADEIDVLIYHDSSAHEIGGSAIKVRREQRGFSLSKLFGGAHHFLSADVIEGDEVNLQYTRAKVVRGKNVHIGEGCEIGMVECSGEFNQDDRATVQEFRKI